MIEFENNYFIASDGNVFSSKSGIIKPLRQSIGNSGYSYVTTSINGKRKMFIVHRLVAKYFLSGFVEKLDVNHKNGIKTDNRVENLEMATRKENLLHAVSIGLVTKRPYLDKRNVRSKLDDCQLLTIATMQTFSNRSLGKHFSVSHHTIASAKKQIKEWNLN